MSKVLIKNSITLLIRLYLYMNEMCVLFVKIFVSQILRIKDIEELFFDIRNQTEKRCNERT